LRDSPANYQIFVVSGNFQRETVCACAISRVLAATIRYYMAPIAHRTPCAIPEIVLDKMLATDHDEELRLSQHQYR